MTAKQFSWMFWVIGTVFWAKGFSAISSRIGFWETALFVTVMGAGNFLARDMFKLLREEKYNEPS